MEKGVVELFGFKIFRLKMAQENCEFLLVDFDNNKYYQYSFTRGKDMLKMMIEKILGYSLEKYMIDEGYLDRGAKVSEGQAIYNHWVKKEIILIDNLNYRPIDDEIYSEENYHYYNLYKKSKILKKQYEKNKGFPMIKKLFMNLVSNDEKGYLYFIKWLGWQIQNPEKRLATSIVLQGEQGSGKTLMCNYVFKKIFEQNFLEISQSDVQGDYGEYLIGKQLIVANEVLYNERRANASEKIKNLVSDDFVNIQRKYKDSLYIRNYSHWIFTSNNQIPIKIERGDRRFTVFKSRKLIDGVNFFIQFNKVIDDEIKEFVQELRTVTVDLNEINYPYMNVAKKDIIEASLNSVELFIETVKEAGGLDVLNKEFEERDNLWHNFLAFLNKPNNTYIKLDSLYQLYMKFCNYNGIRNKYGRNGFTSNLKHLNYMITIIKDEDNKSQRVMKLAEGVEK